MLGTDLLHSGQSLLQTVATLLQKGKGITKWGNLQVGQLCVITKRSKNFYKVGLLWYKSTKAKLSQNLSLNHSATTSQEILKIFEFYLIFKHFFFEA